MSDAAASPLTPAHSVTWRCHRCGGETNVKPTPFLNPQHVWCETCKANWLAAFAPGDRMPLSVGAADSEPESEVRDGE